MTRSFLQRALEADEKALLDWRVAQLERKDSGELLLGKRRIAAKRRVRPRADQHPIHLDAYVPNVFAQYMGGNGVVKNVPVTYRDLGRLKESELLMHHATHLTPTMRMRYEETREQRVNAEGEAWQVRDIERQKSARR